MCRNRRSSPNPRRDGRESSNFRPCPGWAMRRISRPWRGNSASSGNSYISGAASSGPEARMHRARSAGQRTAPAPSTRPAPRHRQWRSAPGGNGSKNLNEKSASSSWIWIFSRGLAASQGATPGEGRSWRDKTFAVIRAEMELRGDHGGIERMCALAGVSRASYYRHWLALRPRQEETAPRDEIQRLSLARRKNGYREGYRLITIQLQRAGWAVNHKRVSRIRREDNLLCVPRKAFRPATTDGRHRWRVWPNLARDLVPMAVNQLWVAGGSVSVRHCQTIVASPPDRAQVPPRSRPGTAR